MTVRNVVQGQILFEPFVETLALLHFLLTLRSDYFRSHGHYRTRNAFNWRKTINIGIQLRVHVVSLHYFHVLALDLLKNVLILKRLRLLEPLFLFLPRYNTAKSE